LVYEFRLEGRDARVLPRRAGRALGLEIELEIEGRTVRAVLEEGEEDGDADGEAVVVIDGEREPLFLATRNDVCFLHWRGRSHRVEAWNALDRARETASRAGGAFEIRAPMPGVVVAVAVAAGDAVETGTLLLTIESMKLQTAITAGHPARVAAIFVAAGENFDQNSPLVRLEPLDAPADAARVAKGTKP